MNDPNRTQMVGTTQLPGADANRTQMSGAPLLDANKTMMGSVLTIHATQTIKPVQCPVCRSFNPPGVMWCVECGLIFDRALDGDAFGAPTVVVPVLVESGGREHPIRPGENSIGREGDILLADTRISRRHARITSSESGLEIEDLGSTNGTKVDGEALAAGEKRALRGGEKLSFGGFEVQLQMPGAGGNTTQAFGSNQTQAIASNRTAAMSAAPTRAAAPAYLVVNGVEHALKVGVNSFGRKAENDIALSDPYVSGRHGTVEFTDEGFFVTDIGSTNGTMLGEVRLGANLRTLITEQDVMRIGSLEISVRRGSA